MSEPSFTLIKGSDGVWVASKSYRTRGLVKIRCGDGSKKNAEEQARRAFEQRDQAAEAGRARWRKTRAQKAAAAAQPPAPPEPETRLEPENEPDPEVTPIERPSPPPPADEAPPAPKPAAAERANQIRAKLLALGDGQPIQPDTVHPPGEDPRKADQVDDGGEGVGSGPTSEEGELLAELAAGGLTIWHVKRITKALKNGKPPKRPGEANERFIEWEREGMRYHFAKLFGQSARLSPFMKMLAGIVGTTVSMMVDAEEIEPSTPAAASPPAAAAAPPAPPPAPPDPPAPPPAPRTNVVELMPLGRFK